MGRLSSYIGGIALFAVAGLAADPAVFGPQTYVSKGRPVLQRNAFPIQTPGTCTLHIANRGVSHALVVLNGRLVLRPSDFFDPPQRVGRDDDSWDREWDRARREWRPDRNDRTVTTIDEPVTLRQGSNEILVAFISRPGTSLTVSITGQGIAPGPTITATPSPAPNGNGWNNSDVTVTFACTNTTTCPAPITVTTEGANQLVAGTATGPGGTASTQVTLNIDKTPPIVGAAPSSPPNASGWNNSPVVMTFSASDGLSGVAPGSLSAPVNLGNDGTNLSVTGQAADLAGNVGSIIVSGINIDQVKPTITATLVPPPSGTGPYTAAVTVHFDCFDAQSGILACPSDLLVTTDGINQTASGTAVDRAGNTATVTSAPFTIDLSLPHPTHALGPIAAMPASVPSGALTQVIVTEELPLDSFLLASSLRLARYDTTGNLIADLGPMFDDGTHGDETPGDGVFSTTIAVNEAGPLAIVLQATAAFSDDPGQSASAAILLPVTVSDSGAMALSELAASLRAGDKTTAYRRLGYALNNQLVLDSLDTAALNRIADALAGCIVVTSSDSSQFCHGAAINAGVTERFHFFVFRDVFGLWRVISW
jgi:hypothetical protein